MLKQLITSRTMYSFSGKMKPNSKDSHRHKQRHEGAGLIFLYLQNMSKSTWNYKLLYFIVYFYQIISKVNETFIGNIFLLYDLIIPRRELWEKAHLKFIFLQHNNNNWKNIRPSKMTHTHTQTHVSVLIVIVIVSVTFYFKKDLTFHCMATRIFFFSETFS